MPDATEVFISHHDDIDSSQYDTQYLTKVIGHVMTVMSNKMYDGLKFAYFNNASDYWHKPKMVDIYITNDIEGRQLNLDARGKDYATNILSYPSALSSDIMEVMGGVPLGELIICHDVLVREAKEQNKPFINHLTHLLVHGLLHLLGFDHEISDKDAVEMENFEIEILRELGIDDPYS
ncbi:rRNA maturation RNase YbeY [Moraxella sp. Pampa]|uniref:rRNA maturation RNase YbeY n=1 Tax=Moraxella sp. Pampa TaxID=3111978 RepID=UPI002B40784E|nr:rRNA maturation RNase YbeY [Moraxella sp. Pampa]